MRKLKAYLIDPKAQTITEVKVGKGLQAIYGALKCKHITTSGRALRGSYSDGFDSILVSDEPIEDLNPEDTKYWFQVDADRDPPSSYPICGRGLVQGADKFGETCDVTISIAEVRNRITFTQRRFQGFETTHGFTEMFGKRMPMMSVSPIAPIVDGAAEKEVGEMSNTYVFTPRVSDGVRLHLRLNHTDHAKIKRKVEWSATVVDQESGVTFHVCGAPCDLPGCFCDAIVEEQVAKKDAV